MMEKLHGKKTRYEKNIAGRLNLWKLCGWIYMVVSI
jgi:hypothetical protein